MVGGTLSCWLLEANLCGMEMRKHLYISASALTVPRKSVYGTHNCIQKCHVDLCSIQIFKEASKTILHSPPLI